MIPARCTVDFGAEKWGFANYISIFGVADFERIIECVVHCFCRPCCPRHRQVANIYDNYNGISEQFFRGAIFI